MWLERALTARQSAGHISSVMCEAEFRMSADATSVRPFTSHWS